MAMAAAAPHAETVPVTRWTGAAGLTLVVLLAGGGSPGAPQAAGRRGLRSGPHGVAVREGSPEVWYPATCTRRPQDRPPCAAATPDSGRFPLLVYVTGRSLADTDDAAAAAYFVSHGYVVVRVPAHGSAVAARAAAATLAFVDSTRSALWRWDEDRGERAGPWHITVTAQRSSGAFAATVTGPDGAHTVALCLPASSARRLAVVIGRAFFDAVLRDWGPKPDEIGRRLAALGLTR
jgi:hypothetical protein